MKDARLAARLGPWPQGVPLEAAVVNRVACDGYVLERVEYQVARSERISAFLLVPDRAQGAVFCHHQHADQFALGKSEVVGLAGDPDQAIGPELARRGYLVLAPDAAGFEERNTDGGTSDTADRLAAHLLVTGRTMLTKVLHDVQVGLDYLQHRSDHAPMGFIGHSYGGRMAIWIAALNQRIAAAVSHCGALTYQDHLRLGLPIQPEFVVPGITSWGDLGDVAALSTRPLLISSTTGDRWSPSAQEVYERARDGGAPVSVRLWPGGHVFSEPMRLAAYQFLDEHLT